MFFLSHSPLRAQDVTVKVRVSFCCDMPGNSSMLHGRKFRRWGVCGSFISRIHKLMGPQTSYSSSTQIINGKMSHSTLIHYVYYLQAVKEGKYVIPPAVFTLKNKTYSSDSLYIEVIGSSSQQNNVSLRKCRNRQSGR